MNLVRLSFLLLSLSLHGANEVLEISCSDRLASRIPKMEELIREAGFEPRIRPFPPERSLQMLRSGEVAGEFMRTDEALSQYPELVKVDVPLLHEDVLAVSYRKDITLQSVKDLTRYRTGYVRSNRIIRDLLRDHPSKIEAPQQESFFLMLKEGRFDVGLIFRDVLGIYREKGIPAGLTEHTVVMARIPLYFAVHSSRKAIVPRLTAAFGRIMDAGWTW